MHFNKGFSHAWVSVYFSGGGMDGQRLHVVRSVDGYLLPFYFCPRPVEPVIEYRPDRPNDGFDVPRPDKYRFDYVRRCYVWEP